MSEILLEEEMEEHVVGLRPHKASLPHQRPAPAADAIVKPPKPRGRRWVLAGVAAAAALLGAGGGWLMHQPGGEAKDAAKNGNKAMLGFASPGEDTGVKHNLAKHIETTRAEAVPHCDILRLTGSLAADEQAAVASNATGIVAEVRVDRGSFVKKGDVLVQIDPTDAKNQIWPRERRCSKS